VVLCSYSKERKDLLDNKRVSSVEEETVGVKRNYCCCLKRETINIT